MLIIRGGINSKTGAMSHRTSTYPFYYNKNKHADTYIMYLHAYSTSNTSRAAGGENCLQVAGHAAWNVSNSERHSSSRMPDAAWLEIPDFTIRIVAAGCI